MHIFHVTVGLEPGGAESLMVDLCVQGVGNATHAVLCLKGRPKNPLLFDRLRSADVPVYDVKSAVTLPAPDLVHGSLYHGNAVASALATRWKVPAIHGFHTLPLPPGSDLGTRASFHLGRRLHPALRIACADSVRREHIQAGYGRLGWQVIANGVDTERFAPAPDPVAAKQSARQVLGLEIPQGYMLIGHAGRWDPSKNHEFLMAALAQLPQALLVLCGAQIDENNRALLGMADKHGVRDRVILLGVVEDMPTFYRALDLFALPSQSEALPLSLVEAIACEIQVVASSVGDIPTLFPDIDEAPIMPPKDFAGFVSALGQVWQNIQRGQTVSPKRRQHIIRSFSQGTCLQAYGQAYRRFFNI